jgi:rhodanese-related sulfurtransferase
MKNLSKLKFPLLVIALLAGVWYFQNRGPSKQEIIEMTQNQNAVWIDVREDDEVREGTLQGAYWLPLSLLESGGPALEQAMKSFDKSKELLLFCRSGGRSGMAASMLAAQGYKTKNLGGFAGLAGQGKPTHQPKKLTPGQVPQ